MTISDCLSLYRSNIQAYAYNQTQIPIVIREHAKFQETIKLMSPIKPAYLLNFLCTKVRTQRAQA